MKWDIAKKDKAHEGSYIWKKTYASSNTLKKEI